MTQEPIHDSGLEEDHAPWKRGAFVLFLILCFGIAEMVLWAMAIVQFLWLVFRAEPNPWIVRFGASLSIWLAQTVRYISATDPKKPFPFSEWPTETGNPE